MRRHGKPAAPFAFPAEAAPRAARRIGKLARNPESLKNLRPGNKRGPAKTTKLVKDAIIAAAEAAGGKDGMVGYLAVQAQENPAAFMALLGKVLPMQVEASGPDGGPIEIEDTGARDKLAALVARLAPG